MTDRIHMQGEVIPWRAGNYELVYSVTNRTGDTVSALRSVTVEAIPVPDTVEPEEKTIYLTFDDGPSRYTERLLDVLDQYDVKATFFVTCDQPDYFHCIARAHAAGHTIGIHSASHVYSEIYSSEEAFFEDFQEVRAMIFEQTGEHPTICRFPGGSHNTVSEFNPGIMTRLVSDVRDLGYQYFDWDVYSGDAGGQGATTKSDIVFANVTEGIGDSHHAIVLQHDIKGFSVDAVEKIILWGLENGYTFRTLDAGSPPAHEKIAN
jgi:peptidoglycan/xylan/chitin deacetylase (PgdA/CDA1 family)